LKALTSNENKRKQSEMGEEGEAQAGRGLNSLQYKLFMGKMSRKKPMEELTRFLTGHMNICLHYKLKCKQTKQ